MLKFFISLITISAILTNKLNSLLFFINYEIDFEYKGKGDNVIVLHKVDNMYLVEEAQIEIYATIHYRTQGKLVADEEMQVKFIWEKYIYNDCDDFHYTPKLDVPMKIIRGEEKIAYYQKELGVKVEFGPKQFDHEFFNQFPRQCRDYKLAGEMHSRILAIQQTYLPYERTVLTDSDPSYLALVKQIFAFNGLSYEITQFGNNVISGRGVNRFSCFAQLMSDIYSPLVDEEKFNLYVFKFITYSLTLTSILKRKKMIPMYSKSPIPNLLMNI
jgi:hypothetical protein